MASFIAALVLVASIADTSRPAVVVHLPPGVQVTPDGSWVERDPNTNGYAAVFRVTNTQSSNATYDLTRESSANVTTTSQSHDFVTLGPGAWIDVTVNYNVGAGGPGYVTLWAEGSGAFDSGTWNVAVGHTVAVTPDGQTGGARITQTGGYTETFTVKNNGGNVYTYALSCSGSSNVNCTSVNPASVTLNPAAQTSVVAAYGVGNAGTGALRVTAVYGSVTDSGSYTVPVNNPLAGAPIVDASPQYGHPAQNMTRCALSCFAATYVQSTAPYFSLDAPRSVTLAYHGDRVNPKPFVHVNVRPDSTYGQWPSEYRVQVKVNGAFVRFVNGEGQAQPLRFAYPANVWARLGGQIDTSYATGVYPMDITVSSYYTAGGGSVVSNTWTTKLVVVNESDTLIARGWTLAGIQRLYVQGDGSALITEGDGSAVYFAKVGSVFVRPPGEFSQVVTGQPGGGAGWTRSYVDSTKVVFNSTGRMVEVRDRFNSITTVVYDGNNRVSQVKDPLNNAITLTYDGNGLTSIQDPAGRVTDVVAASKRLTTFTDPDNVSTTFGYDGSGRLSTITNRRGHTITLGYDSQSGKLTSVTTPAVTFVGANGADSTASLITTLSAWHKIGVPYGPTSTPVAAPLADTVYARVTDAGGHSTRFTVNHWGTSQQVTDPLGFVSTVTYEANGLAIRTVAPSGAVDTAAYGAMGLPTYMRAAGGTGTNVRYTAWAQSDSAWGDGQPSVRRFIGPNGRVDSTRTWSTATGEPAVTRYVYDTRGRVERVTDPEGHLAGRTWYLGTNSNRSKDSLPGGRVTTYGYDSYGRRTSVSAPGVAVRTAAYDLVNRQLKDSAAGLPPVVYAYDSLFLRSVTDPKAQVYSFAYNALGWLITRTDPVNKSDQYAYGRDGELRRWTNRRNQITTYTSDEGHRPTKRRWVAADVGSSPVDSATWGYSPDGRVVTATTPVTSEVQYFDMIGRLDSVRTTLASQTFQQRFLYTTVGRLDSVAISGGGITFLARKYLYDAQQGTLSKIRLGGGGNTTIGTNKDRQVTGRTFPGFDQVSHAYTSVHAEAQIWSAAAYAQTVRRFLGFDAANRVASQIDGSGTDGWSFAYDAYGRLTAKEQITWQGSPSNPCDGTEIIDENGNPCTFGEPGGEWVTVPAGSVTFSYDSVGNRRDQAGTYGPGNRIRQFASCTYVTDSLGDGNVLSRTCGTETIRFHWTAESRLMALKVVGGDSVDFRYDAAGRLVRKDVNTGVQRHFLWQGQNLLAELNATATGKAAEYSYYPGLDNPHAVIIGTTPYYAHTDGLGSVIALTDSATPSVERSYDYDAWGSLTGGNDFRPFANADRARFKGALWLGPEVDVYFMRARWYEPKSGRFLSEDPVGLAAGINPYTYGGSDPINHADPSGLQCEVWVRGHGFWSGGTLYLYDDAALHYYFAEGDGTPCQSGGSSHDLLGADGICRASTLAGEIVVDGSIADAATAFINVAVQFGANVQVTSSFRTTSEQMGLWLDRYIFETKTDYPVDYPGTSMHEAGFSLDLSWKNLDPWSRAVIQFSADAFGFRQGISDKVHFQWTGGFGPWKTREAAIRANQARAAAGSVPGC